MGWLLKSIWYGATELDKENRLFVWIIEKCKGVYGGEYEEVKHRTYSRYLEAWKCQYKARHISGWYFNSTIIYNSHTTIDTDFAENKDILTAEEDGEKLNHLSFLDDLKLFTKNENK